MQVSGQLHPSAVLPAGIEPRNPLDRRLGRSQSYSTRGGEEKNLFLCRVWNSSHPALSLVTILNYPGFRVLYAGGCIQKFPDWIGNEITMNTRWEATRRVMAAKLTRLTRKAAIQLHLVAESCTICSSRSRRPVRKLLNTPSYIYYSVESFCY